MTLWHPLTFAMLQTFGFVQGGAFDMTRGNWRIWPDKAHEDGDDPVVQFPLTLEHDTRGVVLKFYEPPMLDLLRYLG